MFKIKPKTRKEIYMAYLAGDMSLELPEPLTRDEVNLYNLCQSHACGEFAVTFTVDPYNGDAVTCDKSFDEIVNAYNSGCKMMGYMIREGLKSNLPSIRCDFEDETRQWCDFSGFVVWSDPAVWFYSILYNREGGQEEMVYSNITYPEGVD